MAILINDNYSLAATKPFDARYLNISTPWTNVPAVLAGIPTYRYIGLTVNIAGTEWWWKNGVSNGDLEIKTGTLTGATNGLHLVSSGTSVALGGVLSGDTTFNTSLGVNVLNYDVHPNFTGKPYGLIDKQYTDNIASGLLPKRAAVVTTTGNTVLIGLTTVDGTLLSNNDRVLVKNQSNPIENGVYDAHSGAWTRSSDFTGTTVISGTYLWVLTGTTNGNSAWVLDTADPITIGSTPLSFVYFNHVSDVIGSNGITVVASNSTHDIRLGGALTCNTTINLTSGYTLQISGVGPLGVNSSALFKYDCIQLSSAGSPGSLVTLKPHCFDVSVFGNYYMCGCNGNITADEYVYLSSAFGTCINGGLKLETTPSVGSNSDQILVWNTSDKNVKSISSCGIFSNALTGATNGLSVSERLVKLGGNLTGATTINLCDNSLKLQSDVANAYGLADFGLNSTYANSMFGICSRDAGGAQWGLSGNSTSISTYHCNNSSNGSSIAICNTGLTISNKNSSVIKSVNLGVSGLTYGACYHSCYTDRSLIDREYMCIQMCETSNVINVVSPPVGTTYYVGRYDDLIPVSGISTNQIYFYPTPVLGQRISVVDVCGNALADPITVNGYGKNINDGACSTINTDFGSVTFVYNGIFWSAIAFVN